MSRTIAEFASTARGVAAQVLKAVWVDQAYAAAALSIAIDQSDLSERDRRLCTELVYGTLRTAPHLERSLAAFGKLKQSDPVLMSHLLVAAYQIAFLDRVPVHAAVDEAVGAIVATRGKQVGGFANAILRKFAQKQKDEPVSFEDAVFQSSPSWLRKRLFRDVGEEEARALLVPERAPRIHLRFRSVAPLPSWVQEEATRVSSELDIFRYEGGGDPRKRAEYAEGAFVVQELGAALLGYLAGARENETVLDVCAGRGQKSMQLAEAVGPGGHVVATDLHEHKLVALRGEAERLGLPVETGVWDWTTPPPAHWQSAFDRVLVDAPCSGVGTLRRRPEILRRLTPTDPTRLSELQWTLLEHAALAVKPGGILVFATCSVLDEEGPKVVDRLMETGQFRPVSPPTRADGLLGISVEIPSPAFRLLPRAHDTDGYFIARLEKARPLGN